MANLRVRREAAKALAGLLAQVRAGDLTATTPQERRLVRRLEGAIAALNAVDRSPVAPTEDD
jgi:hypothetical protein